MVIKKKKKKIKVDVRGTWCAFFFFLFFVGLISYVAMFFFIIEKTKYSGWEKMKKIRIFINGDKRAGMCFIFSELTYTKSRLDFFFL